MLAQAELIKSLGQPPGADTSPLAWLMWALVLLLAACLAYQSGLHWYHSRVFVPGLLKDFWEAMAKKDEANAATIAKITGDNLAMVTRIEDNCEARAKMRSDAYRMDLAAKDALFVKELGAYREELREFRVSREKLHEMVMSTDPALRAIGRGRLRRQKDQPEQPGETDR